MFHRIRAALRFVKLDQWKNEPSWNDHDAKMVARFFASETGVKLKTAMLNYVLREQAHAIISYSNLPYQCGYCGGVKAMLSNLETLANEENFTPLDQEPDSGVNP